MRSKLLLLALAGGGMIVACSGDAVASTPLSNVCFEVGFACLNAGPGGDQAGTCIASTCYDLLDASYACGVCELVADGGAESDASDASPPDGDVTDGASASDGAGFDATPPDGAMGADAQPGGSGSSSGGSSSGSGSAAGSSSGGGASPASSSGGAPDAGADLEPTMPGCAVSPPSRTGPAGFALLALAVAAVVRARRRRG